MQHSTVIDFETFPKAGYFGEFGGRYTAETLVQPLDDLEQAYQRYSKDPAFNAEVADILRNYVGRPTPLYHARKISEKLSGAQIYFKREDLCHTGAHKINNTVGQILLAKRMGKSRIIAETGAGQHGVATATICALLGLQCVVYMGAKDVGRQVTNVYRMELLGAEVIPVESGTRTLKDALNEALRDWVKNVEDTFYCIGTVAGPHPYPQMVRDFHKIIGEETRQQFLNLQGQLPNEIVACVGGGSNAMGIFYPFLNDHEVRIVGVEAGGLGIQTDLHAAPLCTGKPGILHGNKTYLMADEFGQISDTHSVSAGLDYPGVGPEHSFLKDVNRVAYTSATDQQVLDAFYFTAENEGLLAALETCHALSYAYDQAQQMSSEKSIVVCFSGRGDKDMGTLREVEKNKTTH